MSGTLAEFPSWEGSGVGRFMESRMTQALDRSNCGIARSSGKEASVKPDEPAAGSRQVISAACKTCFRSMGWSQLPGWRSLQRHCPNQSSCSNLSSPPKQIQPESRKT